MLTWSGRVLRGWRGKYEKDSMMSFMYFFMYQGDVWKAVS